MGTRLVAPHCWPDPRKGGPRACKKLAEGGSYLQEHRVSHLAGSWEVEAGHLQA